MKMTSLCYLERDDEYLMLHRIFKENDENHGKWIGVGGKFENGESPEECMLREVKEETGLIPTSYRYRGIVTFALGEYTEYMHLFTASAWEGTLTDCDEGVLEFKKKSALSSLPMWEGDRIFLELFERETPFFSLKLVYEGDSLISAFLDGAPLPISAP